MTAQATTSASPVQSLRAQPSALPPGISKQVAKHVGGALVNQYFESQKAAMAQILPRHMDADRMLKVSLRCLRTTPKLMDCTLSSLMAAVVTCAQLGLEPNTPQGHIYLIPFENKRKNVTEVQVIIGYKGLIDLARRSGQIESLSSRIVYQRDEFSMEYGTEEFIRHKPYLQGDPGEILGFYSVAKLKDGGTQFEFMSVSKVNAIRDASQGYKASRLKKYGADDTPWVKNYEQMGRKTLLRRICNYLPMSIEMAGAVALDDANERGRSHDLSTVLDGAEFTEVMNLTDGEDGEPEGGDGNKTSEGDQSAQSGQAAAGSGLATNEVILDEKRPAVTDNSADEVEKGVAKTTAGSQPAKTAVPAPSTQSPGDATSKSQRTTAATDEDDGGLFGSAE